MRRRSLRGSALRPLSLRLRKQHGLVEEHHSPVMLTRKLFLGMLVPLYHQAVGGTTVTATQGHLRNVTIDEHFGDEITHDAPIYQPPNKWKTSGGHANPALSLAHDGTWHDATQYPRDGDISMSFGFTGPCNLPGVPTVH